MKETESMDSWNMRLASSMYVMTLIGVEWEQLDGDRSRCHDDGPRIRPHSIRIQIFVTIPTRTPRYNISEWIRSVSISQFSLVVVWPASSHLPAHRSRSGETPLTVKMESPSNCNAVLDYLPKEEDQCHRLTRLGSAPLCYLIYWIVGWEFVWCIILFSTWTYLTLEVGWPLPDSFPFLQNTEETATSFATIADGDFDHFCDVHLGDRNKQQETEVIAFRLSAWSLSFLLIYLSLVLVRLMVSGLSVNSLVL